MNVFSLLYTNFRHDWIALMRSEHFTGKIITRILTMLMVLYLTLNLVLLGYFLDVIITRANSKLDAVVFVNQNILFLFLFFLIFRAIFEKLPQAEFHSLLCLPLKKRQLILSYLIRLMAKKVNVLLFVLIIPFWFKNILKTGAVLESVFWLTGILSLSLTFSLLALLFKIVLFHMRWGFIVLIAIMAFTILLNIQNFQETIRILSGFVFDALLHRNASLFIGCILLPIPTFIITYKFLNKTFYLDTN